LIGRGGYFLQIAGMISGDIVDEFLVGRIFLRHGIGSGMSDAAFNLFSLF
jgi:hypothetical protein